MTLAIEKLKVHSGKFKALQELYVGKDVTLDQAQGIAAALEISPSVVKSSQRVYKINAPPE